MKRIVIIGVMLLFVGLSFNSIGENVTSEVKEIELIMENIESACSYSEIIDAIDKLKINRPIFRLIVNILTLIQSINKLRPLKKRVFIISCGSSDLPSLKPSKVKLLLPFSAWYYSNPLSKTIIVDPFPFSVKVLTGRQLGVMRRFIGVHMHVASYSIFFGHAARVRGFDLSP